VKAELRPRVAARLAQTELRAAELRAFTASLHGALEILDAPPDQGVEDQAAPPLLLLSLAGFAHLFSHGAIHVTELTSRPDQSIGNAFGAGLFLAVWSYSGWDDVTTFTGEIDNPRKHLPRALALSVVVIAASYLLPALASLATGPGGPAGWKNWHSGSFSDVAKTLAGTWLQTTVTVGGIVASAAMFSALLVANARLFRPGAGRLLPEVGGKKEHASPGAGRLGRFQVQ
jgi:amino acid transporter